MRTRMFKTLGCLVLSMTLCAALMSWMQPPETSANPDAIRRAARQAVNNLPSLRLHPWNTVQITPTPTGDRFQSLSATASDWHFLIDEAGRIVANNALGRPAQGAALAVRIALSRPPISNDPPFPQWLCLRELLTALQAAAGHEFTLQLTGRPDAFHNALNDLLQFDGFMFDPR